MTLREAILEASRRRGMDPYTQPFKPSELGIRASDYGSFSDHCSENETCSGKWNSEVILKVAEWSASGRPFRYLLL
jgi:hypothetical protein